MNGLTLNEDARTTLESALRVAAEKYDEHVETLAKMQAEPNANKTLLSSLQAQFKLQASRSRGLATLLGECSRMEVSTNDGSPIENIDARFYMEIEVVRPVLEQSSALWSNRSKENS